MTLPPFEPALPVPVIAAATGAAALLVLARAIFGKPLRPAWFQLPAVGLRLAAIALVALLLMNPCDSIVSETPEGRSLVLLDESASMSLGTRWEDSLKWIGDFREAMTAAGLQPPALAAFSTGVESAGDLAVRKPSGAESNLAAAIERAIATAGATAPEHIVVVSDGRAHDRHALPSALALARARGTGISTHVVGSDTPPRNAGIAAVSAPRVVRSNARVTVRAELAVTGHAPGEALSLSLKDENGTRLGGADLRAPAKDAGPVECTVSFDAGVRTARYTLELADDARDVAHDDDRFEFTVEVATSKLRVLFVEGTHVKRSVGTSGYWWNDMELATRAWEATGEIEAECLTPVSEYLNSPNLVGVSFANGEMIPDKSRDFPKTREELYRYDVMLISDVPVGNFSTQQMQWVVDWVTERGGGFLMGGGYTTFDVGHYDQTPWERIIPVDMLAFGDGFNEQRFAIEIPKAVRSHPLWRISADADENEQILATHPAFLGMNRVRRAKPGALVLATRPDMNNEPVIAAQQYGRGRSIAYLPDPNGGWAREFVKWGPPGGPPQGPHTELGHGDRFRVNVAATKTAQGPPPPHPSPWYGQYWVTVVKWLGENSIRWRRDKLAGRATVTQAQPGHDLPVAAEVLAVAERDALLALNVGARLDRAGSPRVRLEYDRDRREFVGAVPVPADFPGGEVSVIFDTVAAGESLTDAVPVAVRRANREFAESTPDAPFLAELAQAGGGRAVSTVEDAVAVCREAAQSHARIATRRWSQPAWARWPWWAALAALLCVEWAFRRRAATNAALAASVFLFAVPLHAEDAGEIPKLIEQLGAPRVRLRDEAEQKLKAIPESADAVKAAAANSPNLEIRLRARHVAESLRQNIWQLEIVAEGHRLVPSALAWSVVASPDGTRFYTRGQDHVRAWDAATARPGISFGTPTGMWKDWQRGGPIWTLAVSPDGKRVASTDDIGVITIHNAEDGAALVTLTTPPEMRTVSVIVNGTPQPREMANVAAATLWGAAFFADGRRLATGHRGGALRIWDSESGTLLNTARTIPQTCRALAVSPDGRLIAVSIDPPGEPDSLWIWNVEREEWTDKKVTTNLLRTLTFTRDGKRLLAAHQGGFLMLWTVTANGTLTGEREFQRMGSMVRCAVFSPDEKSIFAVADMAEGQISQWDVETGEELWRSPKLERSPESIAMLGPDRFVTIGGDDRVRIWRKRTIAAGR